MKLNCDLGESFGQYTLGCDEQAMAVIDMANIACGFHASDPNVMAQTLSLAKMHNVEIGAHPSYPDRQGFGRRSMQLSNSELTNLLHYQIATLEGMAKVQGLSLSYVKPHGALYNDMMANSELLTTIAQAIAKYPTTLKLMVLSKVDNSQAIQIAQKAGIELLFEVFADRQYNPDGSLVSRNLAGAVHDETKLLEQVSELKQFGTITTRDGGKLTLQCDSLCVHGDNPSAVGQIAKIKQIIGSNE
ncbi:5-oxoprolinase subunit PxpA [Pseudoalteromonas sp. G4]|uniref:5-oxoprolinase subunit PxpA n=1 Tax=Pseudoalteromonas sp. G4 TaxID=2992761 RepID=UPI00237E3BCA|nr:5-oxoprolinase subunit PxpA [Pseudoalteromonas sp. G4]MDE3273887.1 5-oxoprolinase subunit PxpA [Pseudoalteromonas sp. G4]